MKSKRGMAPLLATLVLIVMAGALGVLVMNFGRAQIEVAAQCAVDINLDFVTLNGKDQVCYDPVKGEIFFIVENGASIPIESLHLRIIGEDDIFTQDIDDVIDRAGAALKYISYDIDKYGPVRQLKISLKISLYDNVITCTEQSLDVENIRECEK